MKRVTLFSILLVVLLGLQLGSCKKKKEESKETTLLVTVKYAGDPLEGANVTLYDNASNDILSQDQTDANGQVEYKDIEEGSYYITAIYIDFNNNQYYGETIVSVKTGEQKKVTINLSTF